MIYQVAVEAFAFNPYLPLTFAYPLDTFQQQQMHVASNCRKRKSRDYYDDKTQDRPHSESNAWLCGACTPTMELPAAVAPMKMDKHCDNHKCSKLYKKRGRKPKHWLCEDCASLGNTACNFENVYEDVIEELD